jgi:hypothetical protein
MNNPFDNVQNPFNQGTGGDPQANRRKGKHAEQTAEQYIRLQYGRPEPVPDHIGGRDFDVYDPMNPRMKLYEIEVKSGNASLTGVQEERREMLRDGVEYIVLRFGNRPWY